MGSDCLELQYFPVIERCKMKNEIIERREKVKDTFSLLFSGDNFPNIIKAEFLHLFISRGRNKGWLKTSRNPSWNDNQLGLWLWFAINSNPVAFGTKVASAGIMFPNAQKVFLRLEKNFFPVEKYCRFIEINRVQLDQLGVY
jgi:hypothetical protein